MATSLTGLGLWQQGRAIPSKIWRGLLVLVLNMTLHPAMMMLMITNMKRLTTFILLTTGRVITGSSILLDGEICTISEASLRLIQQRNSWYRQMFIIFCLMRKRMGG